MATTKGQSRRCARTGCRAWAMRGDTHCSAHRGKAGESEIDAGLLDERQERIDRFADLVRAGKHAELIEVALQAALDACATERSLAIEIGALRLMLQRVVATELLDGDPRETTQTMTRLVDAIIRALRMEQTLAASFEDELRAAVTRVFAEQGWLEDA
ncbi:MAG TPA: hypothetical protein VEX37_02670 [Thermomicrobiales bacterium]|jgi:hypothetical protein|nr:hypothetical protein [Thermomicrobiales bacterium]